MPNKLSQTIVSKISSLLERQHPFVDNPKLLDPEFEKKYFSYPIKRSNTSWYRVFTSPIQKVRTEVTDKPLTKEEEEIYFLCMNYAKLHLGDVLSKARKTGIRNLSPKTADEVLRWHNLFLLYRDHISEKNLGLIASMSSRLYPHLHFDDKLDEAQTALLRAIDKFDCARNFKFSTYACRAIIKALGRLNKKEAVHGSRFLPAEEFVFKIRAAKNEEDEELDESYLLETLTKMLAEKRIEGLSLSEQIVLNLRYNLDKEGKSLTLEEIGVIMGVTKERVRQIEKKAIDKIRRSLGLSFEETQEAAF